MTTIHPAKCPSTGLSKCLLEKLHGDGLYGLLAAVVVLMETFTAVRATGPLMPVGLACDGPELAWACDSVSESS